MSALGVVFLFFAPYLVQLFTEGHSANDASLVAVGAAAIRTVAFTQPFWAGSFVLAGALRGTGNTRLPLLITGVAVWSTVALGYLGLHFFQPSLSLVWGAFIIVGPIEVACFWLAWRSWYRGNTG